MRYPEFKEAEFSTTDIPIHRQFFRFCTFVYNNVIWIVFSILYGVGIYYFFNLVFSGINDNFYLNALSVGASLVTFFSAVVSVLSLLNADCMKKFEDDLKLLENRYLNGKKISGWEFLRRYSLSTSNGFSYYISSACYKLYSDENDSRSLVVIVPSLEVDLHDVPCIKQIRKIKRFLPEYISYICVEQKKYENMHDYCKRINPPPNYYIPLPHHIIALYKKIFFHKALSHAILFCFLCIFATIIVTIIWIMLGS